MKKLRMILPAIAIVFAFAAALASNAPANLEVIEVTDDNGIGCNKIGTCTTAVSGTTCESQANTELYDYNNCPTEVNDIGTYQAIGG